MSSWMDEYEYPSIKHTTHSQMRYNIGIQHTAIKIYNAYTTHTPAETHSRTITHTHTLRVRNVYDSFLTGDFQLTYICSHTHTHSQRWIIIEPWRLISIYVQMCMHINPLWAWIIDIYCFVFDACLSLFLLSLSHRERVCFILSLVCMPFYYSFILSLLFCFTFFSIPSCDWHTRFEIEILQHWIISFRVCVKWCVKMCLQMKKEKKNCAA